VGDRTEIFCMQVKVNFTNSPSGMAFKDRTMGIVVGVIGAKEEKMHLSIYTLYLIAPLQNLWRELFKPH